MTNSQKGAIWIVGLAVVFLTLAWFGELALIAALAMVVGRIVLVPTVLALTALAVRKTS
ncbi:hypothetical protein [Mycobacterium colombiense]|uniref:hypothetical protein n=1 Tax=Mycobacterium colombiense TaxID=339268 RepID=UPI001402A3C0|nr:hypothetical protein [Mycobacterium colombiense]